MSFIFIYIVINSRCMISFCNNILISSLILIGFSVRADEEKKEIEAIKIVINNGLNILGISSPERM